MRKDILFVCILVLLASAIVIAQSNFAIPSEARTYESATKEVTFNLVKGWNILPFSLSNLITEDRDVENRCSVDTALAVFVWNPTENKYFGWSDTSDITSPLTQKISGERPDYEAWQIYFDEYIGLQKIAVEGNPFISSSGFAFVSNGGFFVYEKEPCNAKLIFKTEGYGQYYEKDANGNVSLVYKNSTEGKELAKNANLISISPGMIGKTPKEIFSECSIEKINTWSNQRQEWSLSSSDMDTKAQEFQNDENPIDEDLLGIPFLIYVNDECGMQY
ncbi:MAG: hypothetical protein NT129_02030 [Candidatus Aenigmarchaeota archaeon]|nr:hypothetical protein [Candidatus Aenigmarchaeota archaeon]